MISPPAFAPHRPLEPGAPEYVPPPGTSGGSIANWILAGGDTVLVGGPTGVGKSTEIAQATACLQEKRVACFVPVDRWENVRRLDVSKLLLRIAGRVVQVAESAQKLRISKELRASLRHAGVLGPRPSTIDLAAQQLTGAGSFQASPETLLNQALSEVSRASHQGRVALLIDGTERVPEGKHEIFDALGAVPRTTDLVIVVPWHAAFGRDSDFVIRPGERLEILRAPEIEGPGSEAGREFLLGILQRRGLTHSSPLIEGAIRLSGGLPRTLLQLVADAETYARTRGRSEMNADDLASAMRDQQESFRRLLLPGDTEAIIRAENTDGRELELEQRVRLMSHGLLLERWRGGRPILEVHPMARRAVFHEA